MRTILVLLLALALAGCTTPGGEDADNGDGSSSSESHTGIESDARSFLINLGGPAAGPVPPGFDVAPFQVDENATVLFIEAAWTCASPTCALDLILVGPDGEEVGRAPGTGSATIVLEAPPAGEYNFGVQTSTDPVVNAEGDVAASAFYGQAMPAGYTAFEDEGGS